MASETKVESERERIARCLRTQNNRITANPIFAVQQRVRHHRLEESDTWEWRHAAGDWELAGEKKAAELDALADDYEPTPGWVRSYYEDRWEFVQPFFTEEGAEVYIAANRHNLTDPRTYVYGGYRNHEWAFVRELLATPEPTPESLRGMAEALRAIQRRDDCPVDPPMVQGAVDIVECIADALEATEGET